MTYGQDRAAKEQDATEAMIRMRAPPRSGPGPTVALQRTIDKLWQLIADLSDALCDEGPDWSQEGLDSLRRRVGNALPETVRPTWLEQYRDPPLVQSNP